MASVASVAINEPAAAASDNTTNPINIFRTAILGISVPHSQQSKAFAIGILFPVHYTFQN